ncbi:hypothetical protein [Sinorhizobium fredii]|uniref:hypothetical protein n=1 Tax=Rhizobium fredii TaxID=380 RepID=UPI003519469D
MLLAHLHVAEELARSEISRQDAPSQGVGQNFHRASGQRLDIHLKIFGLILGVQRRHGFGFAR